MENAKVVHIRRATEDDLDQIEVIAKGCITMMNEKFNNYQWSHGNYPLRSHFQCDIDNHELWVCVLENDVVAFAALTKDQTDYEQVVFIHITITVIIEA